MESTKDFMQRTTENTEPWGDEKKKGGKGGKGEGEMSTTDERKMAEEKVKKAKDKKNERKHDSTMGKGNPERGDGKSTKDRQTGESPQKEGDCKQQCCGFLKTALALGVGFLVLYWCWNNGRFLGFGKKCHELIKGGTVAGETTPEVSIDT